MGLELTCKHNQIEELCCDCLRDSLEYECPDCEMSREASISQDGCIGCEHRKLRAAIVKHHAQHADDLCWMDDDELYAAAGLPARSAQVGDAKAMLRNCKRFIRNRCFGGGPWKSYAELEAEIVRLREQLE